VFTLLACALDTTQCFVASKLVNSSYSERNTQKLAALLEITVHGAESKYWRSNSCISTL